MGKRNNEKEYKVRFTAEILISATDPQTALKKAMRVPKYENVSGVKAIELIDEKPRKKEVTIHDSLGDEIYAIKEGKAVRYIEPIAYVRVEQLRLMGMNVMATDSYTKKRANARPNHKIGYFEPHESVPEFLIFR